MANKSMMLLCIIAITITLFQFISAEDQLSFQRVHFVQKYVGKGFTNYIMRGNVPIDKGQFAKDLLHQYMSQRWVEAGEAVPENYYFTDVSLMNPIDENQIEKAFWADVANADYGEYVFWPMGLAGLYDPRSYNEPERSQMANSTVWDFDQLPQRTTEFIHRLTQPGPMDPKTKKPRSVVFYLHCQAGCDRTGQMVIAARLGLTPFPAFTPNTLQEYFKLNIDECGRVPNDWSVKATEWLCIYFKYNFGVNMGDCLKVADCKRFGNCTWPPA
jgi:hypothetical protein